MNLIFSDIVSQTKEIPKLTETVSKKGGYVSYGDDNHFCDYLYTLYENSALFNSIISTMTTYVFGNGIETSVQLPKFINRKFETLEDVLKKAINDYLLFGGFGLQIILNRNKEIAEINYIDFRRLRINEEEDTIFYSNDFNLYSRSKLISYPRYTPTIKHNNSIYYYKNPESRTINPTPFYIGCLKSLEIDSQIATFHLNQLINNFSSSCIINMNNGIVSETEMEEIEQKFQEKFLGTQNAGKIILSFNNDSEHATTIERLTDESYDTKYQTLSESVKNDIYTAFKINPCLLGYNSTNGGFSKIEFSESYTLYERTVIKPIRQELSRVLETLFNAEFTFKPFTIDWGDTNENGNIPTQEEENKLINIEGIE